MTTAIGQENIFQGPSFATSLVKLLPQTPAGRVFIDMPIGLPNKELRERACDGLARKILGKKSSSIFSPPCREALQVQNYEQACEINAELVGKRISKQAWNLSAKIREVDSIARKIPLRESHPELCISGMLGYPLMSSKRSQEGAEHRLALLAQHVPNTLHYYTQAIAALPRSKVLADDIIDSMILALSAKHFSSIPHSREVIPDPPEVEQTGLSVCYSYSRFETALRA